jgi:integral membrane protein
VDLADLFWQDDEVPEDVRALNRLRIIGILEGVSFLVLLGIAMPLKYLAGQPQAVKMVGWAHGVLFVAFVAALLHTSILRNWPIGRQIKAFVSALLPFGTFALDTQLRAEIATLQTAPASPHAGRR